MAKKLSPTVFDSPARGLNVFEKSGYAIWRSEEDRFHMTLKSCIHGRFHRHDDDCSMTMWYKGQDLILDAGLLYYQEQDRDRIFVRSAAGHSGFEIPGLKPNRSPFKRTAADSRVESTTDGACAHQGMYERYKMNRSVKLNGKIINISDRFGEKAHSMGARANWLIPSFLTHSSAKDVITFSFENKPVMKFSWSSPCKIQIIESDDDNQNPIFYSPLKHKMNPARRLIVTPKERALETRIELL